jgi:hypothetical protein
VFKQQIHRVATGQAKSDAILAVAGLFWVGSAATLAKRSAVLNAVFTDFTGRPFHSTKYSCSRMTTNDAA